MGCLQNTDSSWTCHVPKHKRTKCAPFSGTSCVDDNMPSHLKLAAMRSVRSRLSGDLLRASRAVDTRVVTAATISASEHVASRPSS